MATPVRTFPNPDPMFRFIDPEDGPYDFWRLPQQQRSLYLRFYLVLMSGGFDEPTTWFITFAPGGEDYIRQIVAQWPDERLERAIVDSARRKAVGLPPQVPFPP